ncbi:solute carrier organic anion transporter family member 74D-like [Planococcus citri]|uniref:solute carrier organic anion transporter family member 74D-like n=1 Tax=Planococcus citri TaxID=170843 RepID=UPI0031F9647D
MQNNEDTTCGFWIFKGPSLQKFANKKAYVVCFGILGCLYSASYAYFNGILSTVEKRFGIPSKVTGIITVGNDISSIIVSTLLTYYASRKHQPRWIGFGMYTIVLFCLLSAFPHLLFGPGEDALTLTSEFGGSMTDNFTVNEERKKLLCDNSTKHCETANGNFVAPVILFIAQFISGLGGTLYHTLGVSYMDDNVKRSKTPLLLSFTYFIRSLGPVLGYFLSSVCLKFYIAPDLTPSIDNKDPRWLGAWWLGWIILAVLIFIFSTLITMFPKTLPKTAIRKHKTAFALGKDPVQPTAELPASFSDMITTFKRLFTNYVLLCNNLAAIFYVLGAMPFFIFLPKYMEIMYAQSASFASLTTGTVGLAFTSLGILLSGFILSKYKPKARKCAAWNVFVGAVMVAGVITFAYLECPNLTSEKTFFNMKSAKNLTCFKDCNCDYVKFSPVCSADGKVNFISPCHAGCKEKINEKTYGRCSCVQNITMDASNLDETIDRQTVNSGTCPVDCKAAFTLFLIVICIIQFTGATGKTTNFLVAVRCVEEKDKPVAMGIGLTMMSIAAFIPSPILFGYIIDRSCIKWGKTCTGNSHCWLYNSKLLRRTMNFTSASFIAIGVLFDIGVWYLVKDIQIFDEEIQIKPTEKKSAEEKPKIENRY